MFFSPAALIPALFLTGLASAQTPEGFTPEVTAKLDIIFGTKAVDTPGASFTRAGTNPTDVAESSADINR